MVKDGHLYIIDVCLRAGATVAMAEAVDLANMMLVLGVRTDADRVYNRALAYFTPDEIAEAFAAARGIASPSQLRTKMKRDGRDLVAQFRALAPARRPISLQTWGPRRVILAMGVVLITTLTLINMYQLFSPVELPIDDKPSCGINKVMILMAQSVHRRPQFHASRRYRRDGRSAGYVSPGEGQFWLDSDQAGRHALDVTLSPESECELNGATRSPATNRGFAASSGPPAATRAASGSYVRDRGECVTYRFEFDGDTNASAIVVLDAGLGFQPA